MKEKQRRLYVDQWNNLWFASTVKELCGRIGYSKARRMYVDKKDGSCMHTGYVIGPHWLRTYVPYETKA